MGIDNVGNTDNSNTLKIGLQSAPTGDNTVQVAIFQGNEAIALQDGDGYTTDNEESLTGISVPNDFSELAEGEQMIVMSFTTSGTDVSGTSFDVYRHTGVAADGDGNPGIQTTKWTLPIVESSTPVSFDSSGIAVDMGLITSTFISMETTNDGTVTDFFPMNDAGDYYVQLNFDVALTTSSGDSFTTFNVPLTVADSVYGSNNATTIDGTDGSDWLYGLGGNDTITGGAGDDVIQGGLGKDTLTGGDGADTFILSAAEAVSDASVADHITDYTAGTDSLALDGGLEFADLTITDDGTDSTVAVTATGAILAIIEGDAGLTADDFA